MSYIPAVINPLRRLPIRQYQGPLRNRLPGLGNVFGPPLACCPDASSQAAGATPDGAACDPNCMTAVVSNPEQVAAYVASLQKQVNQQTPQQSPVAPVAGQAKSLTDWLNQNSSTVLWIAGIGLGVLFLSRLTR